MTRSDYVYRFLLDALNVSWALARLAIGAFAIVMSKPQPAWLDAKRLVRR